MTAKPLYLVLCILGTVVPYVPFAGWLADQRFDAGLPGRFAVELFSTRIGAFFGLDVVISALVLFTFIYFERARGPRVRAWPAVLGTLLVGVSLGFPLYLFERERTRESPRQT